ncbi:MAG: acyltransferase [Pseudomonadota bacterium]|nr:acyltransferase [Pseudomonadota bacterium]
MKSLPSDAKLALNSTLLFGNTVTLAPALFSTAFLRAIPNPTVQAKSKQWAVGIAERWIGNNNAMLDATQNTEYDIRGLEQLDPQKSYLLVANHQSWTDIMVLQKVLNRKIPFFRFFLKQELIWVPIMGLCWWVLDFPFMKRYSKEQLAKKPELKGKDKQTTIDRCKKLQGSPVSIMNFLEGTRFTPVKHEQQQSPYQNLLKPRSAGASYALSVLADSLQTLLNVTIVYPEGKNGYLDFLAGRTPKIVVDIQVQDIPREMRDGDYENDPEFRQRFQGWVNQVWQDKDALIAKMKAEFGKSV